MRWGSVQSAAKRNPDRGGGRDSIGRGCLLALVGDLDHPFVVRRSRDPLTHTHICRRPHKYSHTRVDIDSDPNIDTKTHPTPLGGGSKIVFSSNRDGNFEI